MTPKKEKKKEKGMTPNTQVGASGYRAALRRDGPEYHVEGAGTQSGGEDDDSWTDVKTTANAKTWKQW